MKLEKDIRCRKRVVISGLGVVSPIGSNLHDFRNALINGSSGINYIPEFAQFYLNCKLAGVPEISESGNKWLEKYKLHEADISIRYAVVAAVEAWIDAGLPVPDFYDNLVRENAGAIIGTCFGGVEIFTRKVFPYVQSQKAKFLGSQIIEHWMVNGASSAVAGILALANQTTALSSACATGTEAIVMASERIASGQAEIMLAGGTEPYSPYSVAGFDSMRLLNRSSNDNPKAASRPMSKTAAGFVPGFGSGILVLEELNHALNRNARIYCEIIGGHINSGGQRNGGSMTAPSSVRVVDCITKALQQAEVDGKSIDLVCGHLSGTIADKIEIANWMSALQTMEPPYINSLKSLTGHLLGAAGAVESIAAVVQLYEGFVHPSLNSEDLHPEIETIIPRNKVPLEAIESIPIKYVAKAGFGFGDVNACLILKKNDTFDL